MIMVQVITQEHLTKELLDMVIMDTQMIVICRKTGAPTKIILAGTVLDGKC